MTGASPKTAQGHIREQNQRSACIRNQLWLWLQFQLSQLSMGHSLKGHLSGVSHGRLAQRIPKLKLVSHVSDFSFLFSCGPLEQSSKPLYTRELQQSRDSHHRHCRISNTIRCCRINTHRLPLPTRTRSSRYVVVRVTSDSLPMRRCRPPFTFSINESTGGSKFTFCRWEWEQQRVRALVDKRPSTTIS